MTSMRCRCALSALRLMSMGPKSPPTWLISCTPYKAEELSFHFELKILRHRPMQLKGQADLRDFQIRDGKFCLLSRLPNNRVRAQFFQLRGYSLWQCRF